MTFWLLHALIPFLVWLYVFGGPVYPNLIIPPVLLAFSMTALIWLGYWVTAVLTLAGSVLILWVLPVPWIALREWLEERRLGNSTDVTSEVEK
ncbi:MAG: hypothetical protein F4128_10485 [Gammaproteobacteria bacterium]|nr:hypothetical protein [Gammaproteobacteria bacterium]